MVHYPPINLYGLKLQTIEEDFNFNRNKLRQLVIKKMWEELPGYGRQEKTAHYIYYVEKLSDSNRVLLTRPAIQKLGFDYIIRVENYQFMNNRNNPKHDDILNDLKRKKSKDLENYKQLIDLINSVYLCHDPEDILVSTQIFFSNGYPIDLILKVCKWFFIEQDIRYWNYSGRTMLKESIDKI